MNNKQGGFSWVLPIAIAALIIVGYFLFFRSSGGEGTFEGPGNNGSSTGGQIFRGGGSNIPGEQGSGVTGEQGSGVQGEQGSY